MKGTTCHVTMSHNMLFISNTQKLAPELSLINSDCAFSSGSYYPIHLGRGPTKVGGTYEKYYRNFFRFILYTDQN